MSVIIETKSNHPPSRMTYVTTVTTQLTFRVSGHISIISLFPSKSYWRALVLRTDLSVDCVACSVAHASISPRGVFSTVMLRLDLTPSQKRALSAQWSPSLL